MQDRRFRPGDVLDDYCPRERRVTNHAIVAMIDDEIRRTRCGVCDAEHEYKAAKVPAPRRKTQPPALFGQVLDGLQGPTARALSPPPVTDPLTPDDPSTGPPTQVSPPGEPPPPAIALDHPPTEPPMMAEADREEGPVRRPLIRAQFPKLEGATPVPRAMPEFTVQSLNNRGRNNGAQRHAGGQGNFRRRRPGGGAMDSNIGPMRFRDNGHGQGDGRTGGQGHGQGQGQGGGRRRRGGKKNH